MGIVVYSNDGNYTIYSFLNLSLCVTAWPLLSAQTCICRNPQIYVREVLLPLISLPLALTHSLLSNST